MPSQAVQVPFFYLVGLYVGWQFYVGIVEMAEWRNGGMAEWREWREWQKKWQNG